MKNDSFLKDFIENVNNENLEKMDEVLYYYNQGIEVGKDETKLDMAIKLLNLKIDEKIISQVTSISIKELKQMVQ